jgi:nucleoside-diphosphate-sugar epimerase
MGDGGYVLLTGATGFLGRYLLRDLLASGRRVAVLVRDGGALSAEERVRQLMSRWGDEQHDRPANPVVLAGDVCAPGLGLSIADRIWVARHCARVVHAAADVALRRTLLSDPWQTNVEGTQRLLELCANLGIGELHHVSTAFVCGDRAGPVREDELDQGQAFHNDYERSKFEAERRVRAARNIHATVYRPSVIVGDSCTGYTSGYHGFYRFLELGWRLATPPPPPAPAGSSVPAAGVPGRRVLPLRLPFTGDEPRNLVPVDWVARAIVGLVSQPQWHGRTYHLTARTPVLARDIREVAEEVLGIDGVRWAEPGSAEAPTRLEEVFREQLGEYWPYLSGDPEFDCRNTLAALPRLPVPHVNRAVLSRLILFAVANRWGRPDRERPRDGAGADCSRYVEQFFPESARRSSLARVPLDVTVGLEVAGRGGGYWTCRWVGGEPTVRRGLVPGADVVYRTDLATFDAVVRGRQTPQEAFFARRIEIEGDIEKGLKLAALFGQLVKECPYAPDLPAEDRHAIAVRA